MANIARKSDGRRIFTDEFKRRHIGRVHRGELTIAELSRKLGIARSLLQRWKRLDSAERAGVRQGLATSTSAARGDADIRVLQLLVGRQTVEIELLRTELDALRKSRRPPRTSRQ
jgi:transposase-like protein